MSRQEDVTRAPTWTPWRRGETADSARAVLLSVLGEFVLPSGGTVPTSTLIDGLGLLDIEDRTTRQALARTAGAGLITSARTGRQARWTLTERAARILTEGTERIYHFDPGPQQWDGTWLLILVSVPETNRQVRYRVRVRLGWEGLALIAPGVWLSPWADREPAVRAALEELGLEGEVLSFVGAAGTLGRLEERVYAVWDLSEVEAEYAAFVTATDAKAPADDAGCFTDLVTLVHDWRHFPAADPGLPATLLPDPWAGHAAAELFHDRHRAWLDGAWRWWEAHAGARRIGF